jgi:hypothetical protein
MTAPRDTAPNTPPEAPTYPQTARQPTEPGYLGVDAPAAETLATAQREHPARLDAQVEDRLLTPAAVAGKFLVRLDSVMQWIESGTLPSVQTPRGPRVRTSALEAFADTAYRRENHPGINHGLHSRPDEPAQSSFLPVPVSGLPGQTVEDPRWPFPPA